MQYLRSKDLLVIDINFILVDSISNNAPCHYAIIRRARYYDERRNQANMQQCIFHMPFACHTRLKRNKSLRYRYRVPRWP
jgi:hypothetical protein